MQELRQIDLTVAISVKLIKRIPDFLLLLLAGELGHHECDGGLGQLVLSVEGLKVRNNRRVKLNVELFVVHLHNPVVLQGIFGTESLFRVFLHELFHEVLSLRRDIRELFLGECEVPSLHPLQNCLVVLAWEGWLAGQHHVENDTDAPEVTLLCVSTRQNFWRDIISGTIDLMHLLSLAKDLRGAEVDDLDLALVLRVNQNVLRLEVTVTYLVLMTVGHCGKNLPGDDGGLFLREFLAS